MEQEHSYRKTYTLLVLWIVGLLPSLLLFGFSMEQIGISEDILVKPLLWLISLWLVGLFRVIYRTQNIYWINGISYKQAKEAGEERRKAFALRHLNAFARVGMLYTLYIIGSFVFTLPVWADIGVFMALMIGAAIRTIPFKL